jgi:dienelactone hydrolase
MARLKAAPDDCHTAVPDDCHTAVPDDRHTGRRTNHHKRRAPPLAAPRRDNVTRKGTLVFAAMLVGTTAITLSRAGANTTRPTGYGEKFRNLSVEDSGGGELDDVAAAAEYLVSTGLAEPDRLAIGGGSHGGTMVAYAVTKRPTLFKAAIELYGVTDRATFNERTNRQSAIRWAWKMGGTPAQKPDVYRRANILPDVPKIAAPLLVMHGEDDRQVPPYESAQFVSALKKAGKTHLYFTYPKEGHGFSQRDHRLDAWKKQVAFLDHYLQPEYGRSITSTNELVLGER